MEILVKFPSRERPKAFEKTIKGYIENQSTEYVTYLITLDTNDKTVNQYVSICNNLIESGVKLKYIVGESGSKIKAINRDMEIVSTWEILVLASDDMICKQSGWDLILINEMTMYFPDTDGVLWHWDGADSKVSSTKPKIQNDELIGGLNTMCILGKKYYDRFKYIYHPNYLNLWCDNEFTEVSKILNKVFYSGQILFRHEHWANGSQYRYTNDSLMKRTQATFKKDEQVFKKRKELNFNL
jgi:hypothetical protein